VKYLFATFLGILIALGSAQAVFAQGDDFFGPKWAPTHGFEIERSSPEIIKSWNSRRHKKKILIRSFVKNGALQPQKTEYDGREGELAQRMADAIAIKCAPENCSRSEGEGRLPETKTFRFTFADGYWIDVGTDVACVEFQGKPLTLAGMYKQRDRIQSLIFDTADQIGLVIAEDGSGHYNAGTQSSFGESGLAMLSYIADYSNFPELSLGALGFNLSTAPPMALLPLKQRKAFESIVRRWHLYRIESPELARFLHPEFVTEMLINNVYTEAKMPGFVGYHDQALNVETMANMDWLLTEHLHRWRLEHRVDRVQKSFDHFILRAELFELRMRHLIKMGFPLSYVAQPERQVRAQMSKRQLVQGFYRYVTEAGGDYDHFKPLLRPDLQLINPCELIL